MEVVVILCYDVQFTHASWAGVVLFHMGWLGVGYFDISLFISDSPHFSFLRYGGAESCLVCPLNIVAQIRYSGNSNACDKIAFFRGSRYSASDPRPEDG